MMRNRLITTTITVMILVVAALLLAVVAVMMTGCASPKSEGFAIYLTKNDIPPSQMEALSHVEIADEPIIAEKDIVTYDTRSHEISLTDKAFQRIMGLQVPTSGKSFVVCVDKGAVYWGAFWVGFSSQSFDGITIMKPLGVENTKTVTIEAGYPGGAFFSGDDPRDNTLVMQSLEKAGKLINNP